MRRLAALWVLALALAGALASAEELPALFTIPFPFVADGREFAAGTYEIKPDLSGKTTLTVRNTKTREEASISYRTRLSARNVKEAAVVFDRVGERYYLSEVHMPLMDGFLLQGAPGPHAHLKVQGGRTTAK